MTAPLTPNDPAHPTPERILQLAWGFASTFTLSAAVELDLFTHLWRGQRTVDDLHQATGASHRGLSMILDALVGLGLLEKSAGPAVDRYALNPESEQFLVSEKPSFIGGFLRFNSEHLIDHWRRLSECVRTAQPVIALDRPEEGAPIWDELVDALFTVNYPAAQATGRELARLHRVKPLRVLDVAAGSGVWGIGAAHAEPRIQVTALDLASTLPHTKATVEKLELQDRFQFVPGNLREVSFGNECYEAAILGHICHSEGAVHTRRLFSKVGQALVRGGTIVIAEFVPDDDRRGPAQPLLFALNMLVHTREGGTFTFSEYRVWLEEAGFTSVRSFPAPHPSPLILATKDPAPR